MTADELPAVLLAQIEGWADLPGWAPQGKMREMAALVLAERPRTVVEVGVFGGRSALPQIAALARTGSGLFIGIDPYDGGVYAEGEKTAQEAWMRDFDYEPVRQAFLAELGKYRLEPFVKLERVRACDFLPGFVDGAIDVFHLDGCHYPDVALSDMRLAWPKLAPGAAVWVDDTNWDSLAPTIAFLEGAGAELVSDRTTYRLYRKPAT